jgi:hypothetical protein
MLSRPLLALAILGALTACGEEDATPTDDTNNGAVNNGAVNNGVNNGGGDNNGGVNNGVDNNGAVNNGVNNGDANNGAVNNGANNGGGQCFADADEDGFGAGGEVACGGDVASRGGDCADADAWRNPDSFEVCGDNLDDDCDGSDLECPTTQANGINLPSWDCEGEVPANVYAYAKLPNGNAYFKDGACFVFFEGLPGEFYVQHNLERASADARCDTRDGCTCPSLNGWPSYDRRLYAFTLQGDAGDCAEVSIRDHGGEDQPVSNNCRKYLYQLHFYEIPYSFIASGAEALEARLSAFPTVEVACAEDAPHANLPYATLTMGQIVKNEGFRPAN